MLPPALNVLREMEPSGAMATASGQMMSATQVTDAWKPNFIICVLCSNNHNTTNCRPYLQWQHLYLWTGKQTNQNCGWSRD